MHKILRRGNWGRFEGPAHNEDDLLALVYVSYDLSEVDEVIDPDGFLEEEAEIVRCVYHDVRDIILTIF